MCITNDSNLSRHLSIIKKKSSRSRSFRRLDRDRKGAKIHKRSRAGIGRDLPFIADRDRHERTDYKITDCDLKRQTGPDLSSQSTNLLNLALLDYWFARSTPVNIRFSLFISIVVESKVRPPSNPFWHQLAMIWC